MPFLFYLDCIPTALGSFAGAKVIGTSNHAGPCEVRSAEGRGSRSRALSMRFNGDEKREHAKTL